MYTALMGLSEQLKVEKVPFLHVKLLFFLSWLVVIEGYSWVFFHVMSHSKMTQRNKQIAMGRKKFNMDPKKVFSG